MWLVDLILLPRSTRELMQLNKIWGYLNDGLLSPAETKSLIAKHKWRYHYEKLQLLITFCDLLIDIKRKTPTD